MADAVDEIRILSRVGTIGGLSGRKAVGVDLPATGPRGDTGLLDTLPAGLRQAAARVGERRAMAVWRLQQRGITGTLPELLTYDWLDGRPGVSFEFQSSLLGGRRVRGGAVVDFLISGLSGEGWYIWRIQGDYWHQGAAVELKDQTQKARLASMKIQGLPVVAVVDLWEADIYDRMPEVFMQAEAGLELGGR